MSFASKAASSIVRGSVRLLSLGRSHSQGGGLGPEASSSPPALATAVRALIGGSARFVRQGSGLPPGAGPPAPEGVAIAEDAAPSPLPPPLARSKTGGLAAVARAVSHGHVRFVRRGSEHGGPQRPEMATATEPLAHKADDTAAMPIPSALSGAAAAYSAADSPGSPRGSLVGISLSGLRAFVEANGGRRAFEGKSTNDVKAAFVLPCTAVSAQSYASVARASGSPHIGRANRFLSHVYSAPFLKSLDALEAWEEQEAAAGRSTPSFYYFDLFVVNQHGQGPVIPFAELRDEFGNGVRGVGHTLLLMEWADATALRRMWCVFELYTTLACGVPLDVVMAPDDETAFLEALHSDFDSLVQKTIIDAELATAREPADEENIRRAIVESVGFRRLNELVISGLQDWMAARGGEALRFRRRTLGEDHPHTLTFAQNVGSLLLTQGKLRDAELHFRDVLASRRRTLGPEHPDTLGSMISVSRVLRAQGRADEATALLREAVDLGRATILDDVARAALGPDSLEGLLQSHCKALAATSRLREALGSLQHALGDDGTAPHAANSVRPVSVSPDSLIYALDVLGAAESVLRSRVADNQHALGRHHPTTVAAGRVLKSLLDEQTRLTEAGLLLRSTLVAGRRALDDLSTHAVALSSLPTSVESVLLAQTKLRQAEPLLRGVAGAAAYAQAVTGKGPGGGSGGIAAGMSNGKHAPSPSQSGLAPLISDCVRQASEGLDEARVLLRDASGLFAVLTSSVAKPVAPA